MTTKDEGKTQYIRERLLEAGSEEDLEEICFQLKADPVLYCRLQAYNRRCLKE